MINFNTASGTYTGYLSYLFTELSKEKYPSSIQAPNLEFKGYINYIYKYSGFSEPNIKKSLLTQLEHIDTPRNRDQVAVAFSGGKDSVSLLLYLLETNYSKDIYLYHLSGINRAYPNELPVSQKIVSYLQNKYPHINLHLIIDKVTISGKVHRAENATKNHLILSRMIDELAPKRVTEFFVGLYTEDTSESISAFFGLSDSYELLKLFQKGINHTFPAFRVFGFAESNSQAHHYLFRKDLELLYLCDSCLLPNMYRKKIREINQNKYNIVIPENRCYSCWKCGLEYLELCMAGVIEPNQELINKQLIPQLKKDIRKVSPTQSDQMVKVPDNEVIRYYITEEDEQTTFKLDTDGISNLITKNFDNIIKD